jgi:integrase
MIYKIWLNDWLDYYVRPAVKERTYEKYSRVVKKHILPALGAQKMEELNAVKLQKFVTDLSAQGYSPNTVNGVIEVLNGSLKRATLCEVITNSPSDSIVRPRANERAVECFTSDEQKKIETYIVQQGKMKLYGILLCLYTGLRIGELMALKWSDINFQNGILSVERSCHDGASGGKYKKIEEEPKTENSKRMIPLPDSLLPLLKAWKRKSKCEYVVSDNAFNGRYGVSVRSYQRTFALLLKKLHIPHKGFHSLRHTFATRAIECGMDVKTLSELLGHKTPAVTLERYAHSLSEHKQAMMNHLGKLLE